MFGGTGSGVCGHVISALRLALYADGTAAHVRLHHLWGSARPIGTQQHPSEPSASSHTVRYFSLLLESVIISH